MASKTLPARPDENWPGRRISHKAFAVALTARRKAAGEPELPRNSGKRRTASKRALLKAIDEAGGGW